SSQSIQTGISANKLQNMKLVAKNQVFDENIINEIKIIHQLAECPYVLPLVAIVSERTPIQHAAVFPDMSEDRVDTRKVALAMHQIQDFFTQLFQVC